ncbi:MAG: SDR family oxidoreductase [Actinobacteria bacterium]|nr:SDR family oxidoreductase [Actinomycetota bacterium]
MDIVTGATGFLGNVLVRELIKKGRHVKAFIRKTSDTVCLNDCVAEKVQGNILEVDSLTRAFKGVEYVYHLAGEISLMPGTNKILNEVNFVGTKNVIRACFKSGVKRLIYTSSIHAFRESPVGTPIDESIAFDPENPRGEYDRTKARASLAVMEAANDGLDALILCPTAIIGPYDFRVSNLGSLFLNYSKNKQKLIVNGAYDFVDVRDVAVGHILAAEKGKKGETYILSGERMTIDDLMKLLRELTNMPGPKYKLPDWLASAIVSIMPLYYKLSGATPVFTPYSLSTIRSNSFISHTKATSQLGYCPRPVRQSIEEHIKWFKENNF